jgi:hypothetical protein
VPAGIKRAGKDQLVGELAGLGDPGIARIGSGRHRQRADWPPITQAMAPELTVPARHKGLIPRDGQVLQPGTMHISEDAIAPRGKTKVDAAVLGDCPADRWATLDPQRQSDRAPIGCRIG